MKSAQTEPLAIVFDFDGVLVDSMDVKADAFCALYADQSPEKIQAIRAFHAENGGMPREQKLAHFETTILGKDFDRDRLDTLSRDFSDTVVDRVVEASEINGAERLLQEFAPRYPLFVASATPETELRSIVNRRGWSPFFVAVYGSPRSKSEILRDMSRRHRIDIGQLLLVGDSAHDLEAARSAGSAFLGFADNGRNSFPPGVETISRLSVLGKWLSNHVYGGL
jgi:phosphoglycolate phosphatase-like HAD superfamily hydrolase